jgi:hypothetical protein
MPDYLAKVAKSGSIRRPPARPPVQGPPRLPDLHLAASVLREIRPTAGSPFVPETTWQAVPPEKSRQAFPDASSEPSSPRSSLATPAPVLDPAEAEERPLVEPMHVPRLTIEPAPRLTPARLEGELRSAPLSWIKPGTSTDPGSDPAAPLAPISGTSATPVPSVVPPVVASSPTSPSVASSAQLEREPAEGVPSPVVRIPRALRRPPRTPEPQGSEPVAPADASPPHPSIAPPRSSEVPSPLKAPKPASPPFKMPAKAPHVDDSQGGPAPGAQRMNDPQLIKQKRPTPPPVDPNPARLIGQSSAPIAPMVNKPSENMSMPALQVPRVEPPRQPTPPLQPPQTVSLPQLQPPAAIRDAEARSRQARVTIGRLEIQVNPPAPSPTPAAPRAVPKAPADVLGSRGLERFGLRV